MGISKTEAGSYIGYTMSWDNFDKPTLYFTNGRYTQSHKHINNIGWHLNDYYHYGGNISKEKHEYYTSIRGERNPGDREAKEKFKEEFRQGHYDSKADDALFFECSSSNHRSWLGHPSRSKLIKVGSAGFNSKYDEEYATGVLKNGIRV
ncbi:hypothetical protein [Aquimarina sp. 2201CG14-23]|uniref:hypothetical protein n=1 Tax=Aquimarina mycalae TaxID=3040073 RepID=UPI0024780FF3|nr:hypothetical protein [Aquimarina sp. 2201CG14-23]MDH7447044.1 hypothetical protein [Aquimarina sp. 2201CG14-23]